MFWFCHSREDISCYISKELVADKKLNAGQVVREWEVTRRWRRSTFLCYCRKNAGGIQEALNKAVEFVK
jgi:alanyl-tRNA synthetase